MTISPASVSDFRGVSLLLIRIAHGNPTCFPTCCSTLLDWALIRLLSNECRLRVVRLVVVAYARRV